MVKRLGVLAEHLQNKLINNQKTFMSQAIKQRSSRLIDAIRFPLVVMVILAHSTLLKVNTPISLDSFSGEDFFHLSELFIRSLGFIAVAGFALISGYFFFLKEAFTTKYYTKAIFKRKNSLLYPYVLWNIIAFIALWSKNAIAQKLGVSAGVNSFELDLLQNSSLLDLFLLPIDGPLWYIRELIVITLISPLIGLILRYLKQWAILPFLAFYLFPLSIGISIPILSFFSFGAYLAKEKIDIIALSKRLRWFGHIGTLFFFIALAFYCDNPYYHTMRAVTTIAVVISLFNILDSLEKRGSKLIDTFLRFTPAVFFIYAVHMILIINLVRGLLYTTALANFGVGKTLISLITGTSAVIISYILYAVMKKLMPKTLAVLCGGRA